jgi:hypothetical protein
VRLIDKGNEKRMDGDFTYGCWFARRKAESKSKSRDKGFLSRIALTMKCLETF